MLIYLDISYILITMININILFSSYKMSSLMLRRSCSDSVDTSLGVRLGSESLARA